MIVRRVKYVFTTMEECTNFMFTLKAEKHKGEPFQAMEEILPLLNHPHEKVPFIHIAGSNGKGSTLNFLKDILSSAQYKVGTFSSPHLERVNERIKINDEEIADERFLSLANHVFDLIEKYLDGQYPSFFELMTIIAWMYFAEEQVDIAIIEAGIGGRFDCTNVITPLVSIITTVSLEHTEILGNSYKEVAYQKAGIIKPNIPIITGVSNEEALAVIRQESETKFAPLFIFGEDFYVSNQHVEETKQTFTYHLEEVKIPLTLTMVGAHQIANACCAVTAIIILRSSGYKKLTDKIIQTALEIAQWPGRFERFGEQIIVDGAHNSEGTKALIHALKSHYPNKKYKLIYSVMKDKDYEVSISLLDEVADTIAFTEIPMPRAAKAKELASKSKHPSIQIDENWQCLVEQAMRHLQKDELLVITGSLFFIAEVRKFLKQKEEEINDTNIG